MSESGEKKLFNTREIVGKHIITLEGEDLGTVSRILVNPETGGIAGLTVNAKGWFKGDKALEFSSVKAIGSYAVTVENKNTVNALNAFPLLQQLANEFNLYNTRVITPTGELMGGIEDFAFDAETGKIENFLLSGGLIKNLVKGKAEISVDYIEKIGPDVIIAKDEAQDNLIKVDPGIVDNFDSVKDSLSNWKENLEEFRDDFDKRWDVTLDTAKDVSKRLGEKVKEATEDSRGKSKEFLSKTTSKTSEFLTESKTELVDTYEHWIERLQSFRNRNTLSNEELSSLLWKKVGKDIYDGEGNLIIAKDEDVTPEALEKVQQAKKTKELLLSLATRDVADKLELIEKESEGL